MYNRIVVIICVILILGAGCSSHKKIQVSMPERQVNNHSLEEFLSVMINEICVRLSADGKKGSVVLLDCYNTSNSATDLDEYVSDVGKFKINNCFIKQGKKLRLIKDDAMVKGYLAECDLSTDLANIIIKAEEWRKLGAKIVISSQWQKLNNDYLEFKYDIVDTKAGGKHLFSILKEVRLDDNLRQLMGQKLPGSLVLECKSNDAKIYVDGIYKGAVGSQGSVLEVPYGSHSLRIDKKGYKSFSKNIKVAERGVEHLKVKFTQSKSAPLKGLVMNTVFPGAANMFYSKKIGIGNKASAVSAGMALCFYTTAIMWFVDYDNSNQYLLERDRKKHDNITKVELYSAIGFYAGSVISGWFVGDAYRKVTKRGVEYTDSTEDKKIIFYVTSDQKQTTMFNIGVRF